MYKNRSLFVWGVFIIAFIAYKSQARDIPSSAQIGENPQRIWQRDKLLAETLQQIGTTMKCLMYNYSPEIGQQIKQAWSGNLQNVQSTDITKFSTDQKLNMIQQLAMVVLGKLQTSHEKCTKPSLDLKYKNAITKQILFPKELQDLQKNMENLGATMNCLLSNGTIETGMHDVLIKGIEKYQAKHSTLMTAEDFTVQETSSVLRDLRNLNGQCQMSIGDHETHNNILLNENDSYNIVKRDLLAAHQFAQLAEVLQCLMHVFNDEIKQKIYSALDSNLEHFQKELPSSQLTSDQTMNILVEKMSKIQKQFEALHPHCGSQPYVYDHSDHAYERVVPEEIQNLQKNVHEMAAHMKCLLSNAKVNPQIHEIFAQGVSRYGGAHNASLTSAAVTAIETANVMADLKALDGQCQEGCLHY